MLPRGVASAHRPPPTLRTLRSLQPGLRDHSSETNAVGRPSGVECEESKPQECLLSPASKAHLSVFSAMGFCLREEASLLQPKLGTTETGWKTASPASSGYPHRTHCPPWTTPPPHHLGKLTGLGLPLSGGGRRQAGAVHAALKGQIKKRICPWSCYWEAPALHLPWEQEDASLPRALSCSVEASLLL